jgi:hypothetical protein
MASPGSPEAELEQTFPNLRASGYRITDPATKRCNCIAWAAGDPEAWWQPGLADAYWPEGIPEEETVQSLVALFQSLGHQVCDTPELEQDFEKVAIYARGPEYTHAARQLADGGWTSKLGHSVQIEHAALDALTGEAYGLVAQVLKRPRLPGNVVP